MIHSATIADRISAVRKIEYHGKPVITHAMIEQMHGHQPGNARQAFLRNREQFVEGVDYFDLAPSELDCDDLSQSSSKPRHGGPRRNVRVYTRDGYMKLVKIFDDKLSWEIHGHMVAVYFAVADSTLKVEVDQRGVSVSRELSPSVEAAIATLLTRPELLQALPALLEALAVARTTFAPGEMIPPGRRVKLCRLVRELVDKEGLLWTDRKGRNRPVDESRVVSKMVSIIAEKQWEGVCKPMQEADSVGTWIGHVDDTARYVEAFWDAIYMGQRFVRKVLPQRRLPGMEEMN